MLTEPAGRLARGESQHCRADQPLGAPGGVGRNPGFPQGLADGVRGVHRVPAFGTDPFGWLEAALAIAARRDPGGTRAVATDIRDRGTGRPGVRTHQLLLGVLGAAQHGGRRRDVAGELLAAVSGRGSYLASTEELTPLAGDPLTAAPVAIAALRCNASWVARLQLRHEGGARP